MSVEKQIKDYISSQPEAKQADMQELHKRILKTLPKCKLWYLDGTDDKGKAVTNPNVGYGTQTMKYANGTSREFYRVGFSTNTAGISMYFIGLDDKKYLADTYGKRLGKASVTGYCIKFKALKDVDVDVLMEVVKDWGGRKDQ